MQKFPVKEEKATQKQKEYKKRLTTWLKKQNKIECEKNEQVSNWRRDSKALQYDTLSLIFSTEIWSI